jgi:hypothetical protein
VNDLAKRLREMSRRKTYGLSDYAALIEAADLIEKLPQDPEGYRYTTSEIGKFDLWCVWMSFENRGVFEVSRCRWCGYPWHPDQYSHEVEDWVRDGVAKYFEGPWVNKSDAEAARDRMRANVVSDEHR